MDYGSGSLRWQAEQLLAVAEALEADYRAGAMQSVAELVHASVFSDFLAMSSELCEKGYLGAATVVAGSVLEEHIHKLAQKHTIDLLDAKQRPRSMDTLCVELRNAGTFSEVMRKSITAWYAQRNEAAHGRFGDLNEGDVERLIDGVRDFIARTPA
jgi:hypothetical protein